MKIKDIMTKHICCVSPDMTLENASKLMSGADIGVVPVCDSDGLCGIITDRDIVIRGISRGCTPSETVDKVMTRKIYSVSPEADVKEAVKIMGQHQVRRLPVVMGKEVVGIVSVGDLARCGKLDNEVAKAESAIAEMYPDKK